MYNCNLIVLSYHVFTAQESDYVFSRTYKQFASDLTHRDFDWVTIDDGHHSIIKACAMMKEKNIRAKLFIPTSLIGETGYCTWDELWKLSKHHDIENHSHVHEKLTEYSGRRIKWNLKKANKLIEKYIGIKPRYFVPPWNNSNDDIERIAAELGLQLIKNRVEIKNDS